MHYCIRKAEGEPSVQGLWDEPAWRRAEVVTLDHFLDRSSEHRPRVEAKLTHTGDAVHVFFRVYDRYVRCLRTDYQASVCCDSCVEFFARPKPDRGYFNFEINAGGTMLLYYIEDATRVEEGFARFTRVPRRLAQTLDIFHSLPTIVYPEIETPTTWLLEYRVPLALFEAFVGPLGPLSGQTWCGNLYKCADQTSHPHWASWAPINNQFNFHLPEYFAPLRFE